MTLKKRLGRLEGAVEAGRDDGPLTVVLTEGRPGPTPSRLERKNAAGLPVLEIVYDPALGPGELPRAPFKLVHGVDPLDLV
jgi:hypothetical protein